MPAEEQEVKQVEGAICQSTPMCRLSDDMVDFGPGGALCESPIARYSSKVYQGAAGLWASAVGPYL